MKSKSDLKTLCVIVYLFFSPILCFADESLSLTGLKGYTYSVSPIPANGIHLQTGAMYSIFHERNLEYRDGYIWVMPLSATVGDGSKWEIAASTILEYWKNTDFDVDESGLGDLFVGGKYRLLDGEKGRFPNLTIMPYLLFPTGDRDKSIGDLYRYNPGDSHELSAGINLLAGKRWGPVRVTGNIGINYLDSSDPTLKNASFLFTLTGEYQISETMDVYLEYIESQSKIDDCSACVDKDEDQNTRELGLGFIFLKNDWGVKIHMGTGFSETSPDFRSAVLVNRTFSIDGL